MPATPASVPDDTEVIPPKRPEANTAAVPDDTEVIPPKSRRAKVIAEKTQRLCASARDHSARKATAHTGLP